MVPDAPTARLGRATLVTRRGFTLIEMLTVVAALIILLGLMVSLAWDVRRQSSERLTKDLLRKLDVLMAQYVARHKQLPQVTPLIETRAAGRAAPQPASKPALHGARLQTRPADEELPDEETLLTAAEMNNREVVMALRADAIAAGAGPSPELFGPLNGPMYDEVTLRDAWGTPIVFMAEMHPAIGMALGNRPFFLSAGPDRSFRTLEDNLYSYEQGAPEVTE
jgi:type II secretory pathway pseudopilin PulG